MAAIYNPASGTFSTTQLTGNGTPELSPVTASAGGKAVAAWIGATLGDLENPLDLTSSYLMYSVYDGSGWEDAQVLYDGSLDRVTALSAAILYQAAGAEGSSELFCAVLDSGGTVPRTLRLTGSDAEDFNPRLTAVEFPDGTVRFVAGWNHVDGSGRLSVQLAAVNADGTLYPELSLELSDENAARDYDGFFFSKGARTLEEPSVLWLEVEDKDGDNVYEYAVCGAKPIEISDGAFSLSGRARLLELPEGAAPRSLDARTDSAAGEIQLVMVLTDAETGEAAMSAAAASYQAAVSAAEPRFLYADVIPGLELPVSFTVTNGGMEPITEITLAVGGSTFPYAGLRMMPGESKPFTVLYPVPETIADAGYTVTAKFGSAGTATAGGSLKLNLPDIGISQIDATKQSGRERGFRVLLENSGYAPLVPGTHSVRLEVWGNPDFTGDPLWSGTFSQADHVTALNGGSRPVNVALDAAALESLQTYDGSTGSLLRIDGESSGESSLTFSTAGYSADLSFVTVSAGSARLSSLRLAGVPLAFDLEVYDLYRPDL